MKKRNNVIITDYMVLERNFELRKWLRMLVLKNNPISIAHDKIYRDFAGFKYNKSIGIVKNIIFKMMELVENKL